MYCIHRYIHAYARYAHVDLLILSVSVSVEVCLQKEEPEHTIPYHTRQCHKHPFPSLPLLRLTVGTVS